MDMRLVESNLREESLRLREGNKEKDSIRVSRGDSGKCILASAFIPLGSDLQLRIGI